MRASWCRVGRRATPRVWGGGTLSLVATGDPQLERLNALLPLGTPVVVS